MNVSVCVGSSCHIRGSSEIIKLLKSKIAHNDLAEKVNLSAVFCLGKCTDGVSIKVDDEIVCGVMSENFDEFFSKYILERG